MRAALYQALAESLAEPPEWLAAPGREWPLYAVALECAPFSAAARRAATALAEIPAESLAARRARYAALFAGPGEPRFWSYESAARSGRLLGPESFAVDRLYRAAGLEVAGAELPDHAACELAFLAHLAGHGADELERRFVKLHAGRWLPQLGHGLAATADSVYAPIGRLLAGWLDETVRARTSARPQPRAAIRWPIVTQVADCTLCGFCVQSCPTRALAVAETDDQTQLVLMPGRCTGCGRCLGACPERALRLAGRPSGELAAPQVLRHSPRIACRACGAPMVSQAELDFVARQIGRPDWLAYCADCRTARLEAVP